MSKIKLFIATSLDGYIARTDGSIDWLDNIPQVEGLDYGYGKFINTISELIMGRKTYEKIRSFGVEWPYPNQNCNVITSNNKLEIFSPNTYLYPYNRNEINNLRSQSKHDIWVVGGGQLITKMMQDQLIDELTISLIPVLIGKGIPLIQEIKNDIHLSFSEHEVFSSGVINLTYKKPRPLSRD